LYGFVNVILPLAILIELQLVTDGQTDSGMVRGTDMAMAYTALAWRGAVKMGNIL